MAVPMYFQVDETDSSLGPIFLITPQAYYDKYGYLLDQWMSVEDVEDEELDEFLEDIGVSDASDGDLYGSLPDGFDELSEAMFQFPGTVEETRAMFLALGHAEKEMV